MGIFQSIKALFTSVGAKVTHENGQPFTDEQIQQIDNSVEFHQLMQTEQAAQFTAQAAKTQEMGKAIAELMQEVKALQASLQTAQATAAAAAESAAAAITAAATANERATAVAVDMNKLKGAPMPAKEEDRAPEGTPEAANNDEELNAFIRMRNFFAEKMPMDKAIESAMQATKYSPKK